MTLWAVVVMTAACGGSSSSSGGGGGGAIQTAVQGSWSRCDGGGGTSLRITLAISGSNYTSTNLTYPNDTCAGTGTVLFSDAGTFAIGAAVTKPFGGASVTAYEITVTSSNFGAAYDLVYVDTAATPDRLYTGDSSGANDGSTPALRPTVLDETFPLTKQ